MAYRVEISPTALADAEEAYLYIQERSPARAAKWYNDLLDTIFSLETMPERCALAPESEEIGKQIHQLLYSKHGYPYRIIFAIVQDKTGGDNIVRIYHILHGARNRISAEDIEEEEA